MAEEQVFFSSHHLKLHGLLCLAAGNRAAVITHPHPLYGGSMHNAVVETLARVYGQQGYTTLRFNFRGVGLSQGDYDGGRGEQEDVKAALDYLGERDKSVLDLVGYSFGAWVNALSASDGGSLHRLVLISPPVALLDFSAVQTLASLKLIVSGGLDPFAPPAAIRAQLPRWNSEAHLEVIGGADHFYAGCTEELAAILAAYLAPA
jgi:alpha/beta superfamily hydrolase